MTDWNVFNGKNPINPNTPEFPIRSVISSFWIRENNRFVRSLCVCVHSSINPIAGVFFRENLRIVFNKTTIEISYPLYWIHWIQNSKYRVWISECSGSQNRTNLNKRFYYRLFAYETWQLIIWLSLVSVLLSYVCFVCVGVCRCGFISPHKVICNIDGMATHRWIANTQNTKNEIVRFLEFEIPNNKWKSLWIFQTLNGKANIRVAIRRALLFQKPVCHMNQ